MATIERIEQSDSGKVALEKLDRNDAALNKELESTKSKTDISFPCTSNYTHIDVTDITLCNNHVSGSFIVKKSDGGDISGTWINIGLLPVGFKPKKTIFDNVTLFSDVEALNNVGCTRFHIDTTGNVCVRYISINGVKSLNGSFDFYI